MPQSQKRDELLANVVVTTDYMARWNIYPSNDAMEWIDNALKTEAYYYRVMIRAVRDAYNGLLTQREFEDVMLKQIEFQFRRGWLAGLRELGVEMTPAMELELDAAMVEEIGYVQGLMDDIVQAARDESGYDQFRPRVRMWANRWDEMRNRALIFAGGETPLTWKLGKTEEHCTDCLGYANTTRTANDWQRIYEETGHRPQSRDLECHGYQCDCEMVKAERKN
jgi:hypothetical protein